MIIQTVSKIACVIAISTIALAQAQAYTICTVPGWSQIECDSGYLSRSRETPYTTEEAAKFCMEKGSSISTGSGSSTSAKPGTIKNSAATVPAKRLNKTR